MRTRILAWATLLTYVAGTATSATASDHHGKGRHHGHHGHHGHHFVGSYGRPAVAPEGHYYTDLGPLGFMLGPPPGRHYCGPNCVPGSSISAWSY
jgi:hypothetical protein